MKGSRRRVGGRERRQVGGIRREGGGGRRGLVIKVDFFIRFLNNDDWLYYFGAEVIWVDLKGGGGGIL